VGGVWALIIHQRHAAAGKAQQNARAVLEKAKAESLRQLREARAELTDWQSRFQAADAVGAEARTFIADLETTAHTRTPYENRTVVPG
jgi:hypothetical protein